MWTTEQAFLQKEFAFFHPIAVEFIAKQAGVERKSKLIQEVSIGYINRDVGK
jgi:hypothetical protein